jgi:lysophospholipase L1-like esterase
MKKFVALSVLCIFSICCFAPLSQSQGQTNGKHWVSAWTTSLFLSTPMPGFPAESPITDKTVRVVTRPTIGGKHLRVRLSNEFGTAPLTIAAAHIALTDRDSRIQPATDHVLTFGGRPKITIPVGAPAFSDPVEIAVKPFAEVSISLYVPGAVAAVSSHPQSLHDSYFAGPGDMTSMQELPNPETKRPVYFVSSIDIWAPYSVGATVAFGDSITEGAGQKPGQYIDYPDQLAKRLAEQGETTIAIVNQGIGGNRILHDVTGPSALARFDRDVLSLPGTTNMIVLLGINDIGFPRVRMPSAKGTDAKEGPFASQAVSADEMTVGLKQIIGRAHAHGIKVFGATLTPFEGTNVYDESGEAIRQGVNKWIRSTDAFDAVFDFDQAIRDPEHPTKVRQEYDSGDHIHPSAAGYKAMADLIPLSLLRGKQMKVLVGQASAQQPSPQTNSIVVKEPVFQTNGPYKVQEMMEPSLSRHTVYRPIGLKAVKGKLPIVAFGNGGCSMVGNAFETYLTEIASYGFLVIASGPIQPAFPPEGRPGANGTTLGQPSDAAVGALSSDRSKTAYLFEAIDWAVAQNKDPKSPYYGRIAADMIAVSGQSCGALEALEAAVDPRVKTAIIFNSGIMRGMPPVISTKGPDGKEVSIVVPGTEETLKKLHTPVIYLIGGEKDIAYKNSEIDYQQIEGIPLFNANLGNVGHNGSLGKPFGGKMAQAARLWLQWQLKGDREAGKAFVGPDCTLCKDPEWLVKKKYMK